MAFGNSDKEQELRTSDFGFTGRDLRDYPIQKDMSLNKDITPKNNQMDILIVRLHTNKIPMLGVTNYGSDNEHSPIRQDEGKKVRGRLKNLILWMVLLLYQLALLCRATGSYENLKLECPRTRKFVDCISS